LIVKIVFDYQRNYNFLYIGAETQDIAAGGQGIALPEPLQDADAKSWFRCFEICSTANGWEEAKQLLCLPMLLRGRAWAVYEALADDQTDTYAHLKAALLAKLSPDTDEHCLSARE